MVVREMRNGSGSYGFDASRRCFTELVPAGIVDPTKVVRVAIENAVSVAGVLLLTSATLTEGGGPDATVAEPTGAAS
jgi:chaperonin GroEL